MLACITGSNTSSLCLKNDVLLIEKRRFSLSPQKKISSRNLMFHI